MAEINLLQSRIRDSSSTWQRQSKTGLIVLTVILLLLIGAGVGLTILSQRVDDQTEATVKENAQIQTKLDQAAKNIGDGKVFQAQVANLKTLLDNHIYLTPLLNELDSQTYVKAQYMSIDANDNGKVRLQGQVPSYTDLAKLLLGLSTSQYFRDVKLTSVVPGTGDLSGYTFSIDFTANAEIFLPKK